MSDNLQKRKTSLVKFFIVSLGITIILLNAIQSTSVAINTKSQVTSIYADSVKRLVDSNASLLGNKMESYLNSLNYYIYSDVAQTEDTEEISYWLTKQTGKRHPEFDYIVYGSPDFYWHQENGSSGKTNGVYFEQIMSGGKDEYIDNPKLSNSTGQMNVHVAKAVKKDGRTIGLFSGTMGVKEITSYVNSLTIGNTGFAWIMDTEGNVVIHRDPALVMTKNYFTSSAKEDKDFSQVARQIAANKKGTVWAKVNGKSQYLSYAPVPHTQWILIYTIDSADFNSVSRSLTLILVITSIVTLILLLSINGAIITSAMKPLKKVDSAVHSIASGNADLTQRIENVKVNNEIGSVVEGFNAFVGKLQDIVSKIKYSNKNLFEVGKELESCTSQTASSISSITDTVSTVTSQLGSQVQSVDETTAAVNQVASNIETLNNLIENQSAGVTEASAAVEQMIGNISSVSTSMNYMAESFIKLKARSEEGSAIQKQVNENIQEIQEQSEMLQKANTVIASIASQTNLLAMNAAIEAAHAGKAGQGFSVVADEIRKLSETSSTQSKEIARQLKGIRSAINDFIVISSRSSESFKTIASDINETTQLMEQVKGAMDEQQTGSKQITDSLHSMNSSTIEVRDASSEMTSGNKVILEQIRKLHSVTSEMKDSIEQVRGNVESIGENGRMLHDLSSRIGTSISDISSQIDEFKV